MTEAQTVTLITQAAAVLITLIGVAGTIAVAIINGRIERLKDAIIQQHDDWTGWTDHLIAEVRKLVGGQSLVDALPPRPRLRLRRRDVLDNDEE
jgi:hypothetical protein